MSLLSSVVTAVSQYLLRPTDHSAAMIFMPIPIAVQFRAEGAFQLRRGDALLSPAFLPITFGYLTASLLKITLLHFGPLLSIISIFWIFPIFAVGRWEEAS